LKILCLEGRILSGKGEGAKFLKLPWVKEQIEEKLGFVPYLGTLNLRIIQESVKLKRALAKGEGVKILPVSGFCLGKCYRASLKTESNCAVLVPEVPDYPEDVVEIIGPENLRKKFHLLDDERVQISVMF